VLSMAVVCAEGSDGPLSRGPEVDDALARTASLVLEEEPPRAALSARGPRRALERGELEELMTRFEGHVAAAARHLGTTRPSPYRMLAAHGIDPDSSRRRRALK